MRTALIWSLYFYGWTDVGFEIHGPYEIKTETGRRLHLLIRDFFDPRPIPLWERMQSFPYKSIRIMTLHRPEINLKVDLFNHLTHTGNLLASTVATFVEANGIALQGQKEIERLTKETLDQVSEQHQSIRAMTRQELVGKFIESRYYALRKWRLYFGEDWRPPAQVTERISAWSSLDLSPSIEIDREMLIRSYDPRADYFLGKDI